MEYSMAAIAAGEWSSLISGMYTTDEADFMAQLLNNSPLSDHDGTSNLGFPSTFWPSDIATSYSFSQESYCLSDSNAVFVANSSKNSSMSMDFCMEDASNTSSFLVEPDEHCLNQEILGSSELGNVERVAAKLNQQPAAALPKVETAKMSRPEPITETKNNNGTENSSKKRCRSSGDINQKNKRNARSKKKQLNSNSNKEDGIRGGSVNVQSSASCLSEDDSNASQELNGGVSSSSTTALNLNGKTRASRGAATDPQSLYARKRRERINERLRILQNLVPNGTKVDISTMLEEAVQYVKFLQLQIKLLSSEDLWMYAPIAYNGMDIGLDIKVGTSKRS